MGYLLHISIRRFYTGTKPISKTQSSSWITCALDYGDFLMYRYNKTVLQRHDLVSYAES